MPAPPSAAALDLLLTAQIAVAWAGESGDDEPRLAWWRCDLVSEYGGQDLFQRLLPQTWEWALLQAVREAAAREDARLRRQAHDPDAIVSLFRLGFAVDERADERLLALKRAGRPPREALPQLGKILQEDWEREAFAAWLRGHGKERTTTTPVGRRLPGPPPALTEAVPRLLAALSPLAERYPLPHFRRA